MSKDRYIKGDWNAICDVCGFEYKASELRLRWDGYLVCPEDWESRHAQDFIRTVKDDQSVPWTRPEGTDTFQEPTCTTREAFAGAAITGCAIAGYDVVDIPTGTFNTNTL